jgi:hypothetical protein
MHDLVVALVFVAAVALTIAAIYVAATSRRTSSLEL